MPVPTVPKTPCLQSLGWTLIPVLQEADSLALGQNPLTNRAQTNWQRWVHSGQGVQPHGHQPPMLEGPHDHDKSEAHQALVANPEPLNLCPRGELSPC